MRHSKEILKLKINSKKKSNSNYPKATILYGTKTRKLGCLFQMKTNQQLTSSCKMIPNLFSKNLTLIGGIDIKENILKIQNGKIKKGNSMLKSITEGIVIRG